MKALVKVLIFCVILFLSGRCFASFNDESLNAHFEYPGPAVSERDLPICPPNAVCSVLHNRFWRKTIVKRLCRCLRRIECPWVWTDNPDNNTIHLDSRSQLKFCDEVRDLPECSQRKPALTVTTTASSGMKDIDLTPAVDEEKKLSVNVSCFCPISFVWEELPQRQIIQSPEKGTATVITHYKCKPMEKCSSYEFCGNIRADYFSVYYNCSCPTGHLCLNTDRTLVMVDELLYDGEAYQAFCYPQ